jgi:hypothetical protein
MLAGLLFGLCLATKLQSFLLPVALTLRRVAVGARTIGSAPGRRSLGMMALFGPAVMFVTWPWLAPHGGQLRDYIRFRRARALQLRIPRPQQSTAMLAVNRSAC